MWLRHHALSGVAVCVVHKLVLQRFPLAAVIQGQGLLPEDLLSSKPLSSETLTYALSFSETVVECLSGAPNLNVQAVFRLAIARILGASSGRFGQSSATLGSLLQAVVPSHDLQLVAHATAATEWNRKIDLSNPIGSWATLLHLGIAAFGSLQPLLSSCPARRSDALADHCELLSSVPSRTTKRGAVTLPHSRINN